MRSPLEPCHMPFFLVTPSPFSHPAVLRPPFDSAFSFPINQCPTLPVGPPPCSSFYLHLLTIPHHFLRPHLSPATSRKHLCPNPTDSAPRPHLQNTPRRPARAEGHTPAPPDCCPRLRTRTACSARQRSGCCCTGCWTREKARRRRRKW